jgi:hypothetical protein
MQKNILSLLISILPIKPTVGQRVNKECRQVTDFLIMTAWLIW